MDNNDKVFVPIDEYKNLIACRTMLDMIVEGVNKYRESADMIVSIAVRLRKLYLEMLFFQSEDGDGNVE